MDQESLSYLCQCVSTLTKLPVFLCAAAGGIVRPFVADGKFFSNTETNAFLQDKYLRRIFDGSADSPISYYISDDMLGFGIVRDQSSDFFIYVGPCKLSDISAQAVDRMYRDVDHPKSQADLDRLTSYLGRLPQVMPETLMWLLSFINLSVNHAILMPTTFFSGSPMFRADAGINDKLLDNLEFYGGEDNGAAVHAFEQELTALVASGNLDGVKKYWTEAVRLPVYTSMVFGGDQLREFKNKFIETAAIVCRAAISGGLNPNFAHTLKDIYILRSERAAHVKEFVELYPAMLNSFTSSVNNAISQFPSDNLIVSRAMSYIQNHITEKVTAADAAKAVHVSAGYLSTVFRSAAGVSIPDYINHQKLQIAKNLLLHTDKTLVEVSNYLSFSSQSYFQSIFKKYEGITPTEYRRRALQRGTEDGL